MKIKQRYMSRDSWARVIERIYGHKSFEVGVYSCEAGLIKFVEVANPLDVNIGDNRVRVVDNGYMWLQLAPKGEHWWLTAMYDSELQLKQYYFDITLENHVGEDSFFDDLFLDVIISSDGDAYILDRDELDAALAEGVITSEQHKLSCSIADEILSAFPTRKAELDKLCLMLLHSFDFI